jgi:flagellar basal-body rod protein FlgB
MPDTAFDATVPLVRLALDSSTLEHAAVAHNIANANTPGARVARVDFEQQMAALRQRVSGGAAIEQEMIGRAQPSVQWSAPAATAQSGGGIDAQVARMSANAVRYQTLLKALEGHFSLQSIAINEGKH